MTENYIITFKKWELQFRDWRQPQPLEYHPLTISTHLSLTKTKPTLQTRMAMMLNDFWFSLCTFYLLLTIMHVAFALQQFSYNVFPFLTLSKLEWLCWFDVCWCYVSLWFKLYLLFLLICLWQCDLYVLDFLWQCGLYVVSLFS